MERFTRLEAVACPLPLSGIDTDQLLPARFMKRTRAEGYGPCLLHDLRFDETGQPRSNFPLNAAHRKAAQILITRRNFGGGSSREAAVYALVDYGIRCVIAPSFGDIFAANAVNNGLLPARVSESGGEQLIAALESGELRAHVDLAACEISVGPLIVGFDIDPVWRIKLLNGWDDIDLAESHKDAIAAFVAADESKRPWMAPRVHR